MPSWRAREGQLPRSWDIFSRWRCGLVDLSGRPKLEVCQNKSDVRAMYISYIREHGFVWDSTSIVWDLIRILTFPLIF